MWRLTISSSLLLAGLVSIAGAQPVVTFLDNSNKQTVFNGPHAPTVLTLGSGSHINEVITYHWNNGQGFPPGTISLQPQSGPAIGPFAAVGVASGPVANANWKANVNRDLPAGIYTILDSGFPTWSQNNTSGGAGFAIVTGFRLAASSSSGGSGGSIGPQGPQGPAGPQGPQGPPGTSGVSSCLTQTQNLSAATGAVNLSCPAGMTAIAATCGAATVLNAQTPAPPAGTWASFLIPSATAATGVHCNLNGTQGQVNLRCCR